MLQKISLFTLSLLALSNVASASNAAPCGLVGSVEERIADCTPQDASTDKFFVLVTRDENEQEIYKEVTSGLLWSHRLAIKVNYADAEKLCADFTALGKTNWEVPTLGTFQKTHVSSSGLAQKDDYYWTSTAVSNSKGDYQWIFHDRYADVGMIMLRNWTGIAVRCVTH